MKDIVYRDERIRNSVNLLRALLIQSENHNIILDHDTIKMLYETLKSAEPKRMKGTLVKTDSNRELYGKSSICGICGCLWQIDEDGEDNFCPNCGTKLERWKDEISAHSVEQGW